LKGLTLVELMIVLLIFSIILGAIFAIMNVSRTSWQTGNVQVEMQQETRKGMDRMLRELRQSGQTIITGVPANGVSYSSIAFQIPEDGDNDGDVTDGSGNIEWSAQITYSLGGLDGEQLLRTSGGSSIVMANKIISLQFSRAATTPNILEISLQAQKNTAQGTTIQSNLNSQANLRN